MSATTTVYELQVAMPPSVVTVIGPERTPAGTVVSMRVDETTVKAG